MQQVEEVPAAARYLLRRAARAREDPAEFFELVMREETRRTRLTCAPHQLLFFDFVTWPAHRTCVVRMPVSTSKTYCCASLSAWLLGREPTSRGVVVSASQQQAERPLALVRDIVEDRAGEYPAARVIFPALRPSDHPADPWTQTAITVKRPVGIRDASLMAVGVGSAVLPGARLSWINADDLLNDENTRTVDARARLMAWFDNSVFSRLDIGRGKDDGRLVVTNTPWNTYDLTYTLEARGWPTLTIDVEGGVRVSNTDWQSEHMRPSRVPYEPRGLADTKLPPARLCRLTAHDTTEYGAPMTIREPSGKRHLATSDLLPDPGDVVEPFDVAEEVPLWPERLGRKEIDSIRETYSNNLHSFLQLYMMKCRDDATARCKTEWVDKCRALARAVGHFQPVRTYDGANMVFAGVDIAIGQQRQHDRSSIFVFELLPRIEIPERTREELKLPSCILKGVRKLLEVQAGRWAGVELRDKIIDVGRRYRNCLISVENNAAQDLMVQWVYDTTTWANVRRHHTGGNKLSQAFGVETMFYELDLGLWLIPNNPDGRTEGGVQAFIEGCLGYQPPPAHTPDTLMASWMAREGCRFLTGDGKGEADAPNQPSLSASVMAR